ncbi:MAG: SIMPL domain-containing protein [Rikenellaceae bacterium]|nr:SIMPL domain-containing protein [Rikenellaceae bacterium]
MKASCFLVCALAVLLSGCGQSNGRQEPSTVTVSGVGTVSVEPDMVRMTVSLSETARTTRLAQEAVGKMAGRVLGILKDSGIEDKDIMTASLTFNPEYEWRVSRSVLVGQRAEQGIEFAVRDIRQNNEKVAGIIDRLVEIDGIVLSRINFSVGDNTEHFVRSRELAFEKAVQKAGQYAELSRLKVGKVLSLSEDGVGNAVPLYGNRMVNQQFKMEEAAVMADVATVLPSGQLEVTTRISVVFLLE